MNAIVVAMAQPANHGLGRYVTLQGGVQMPSLGLGSSGSCHPDQDGTEKTTCTNYNATLSAIKLGYRSFHDALSYGNQAGLGAAVRDSGVPRSQLFLMSMVPTYLMGFNETKAAVAASLVQLGLSYLDLVMLHHRAADVGAWPRVVAAAKAFPAGWAREGSPASTGAKQSSWLPPACALAEPTWRRCQDESWKALNELKAAGKVRAIGVSNWRLPNLQRMMTLGQPLPAINQVEQVRLPRWPTPPSLCSLSSRRRACALLTLIWHACVPSRVSPICLASHLAQHIGWHDAEMLSWCAAHGVLVQAATPLARGTLLRNPTVRAIAAAHRKSAAQVALRFLLQRGVAPIAKTTDPHHQADNLDVFDFALTPNELVQLGAVHLNCRGEPALGLNKCWADPADLMCGDTASGTMFHCP